MPICNLATLTVNSAALGEPALDTNLIDVAAVSTVTATKNLTGTFLLNYSAETNVFKAQVQSAVLNIYLNKSTGVGVVGISKVEITRPTPFVEYNLDVITSLKSLVNSCISNTTIRNASSFTLATKGLSSGSSTAALDVSANLITGGQLNGTVLNSSSTVFAIPTNKLAFQIDLTDAAAVASTGGTALELNAFNLLGAPSIQVAGAVSAANLFASLIANITCRSLVNAISQANFESRVIVDKTPNITSASAVLPVGSLLTIFRAVSGSTFTISAVQNLQGSFSSQVFEKACAGSATAAFNTQASLLNITLRSTVVNCNSIVSQIPVGKFIVGKAALLETYVVTSANTVSSASLKGYFALKAIVAGTLDANSTAIKTGIALSNIVCASSTSVGTAKFGIIAPNNVPIVRAISDQPSSSRPLLGQTVYFGQTQSLLIPIASSGIAGLNGIFAIGYPTIKPAIANAQLGTTATISGPISLSAPVVQCASAISSLNTSLLVLGAVDYPDQVQEYVRYPLPTATSAASPVDDDGSPVPYSHSIFGSTLIRLTPTGSSTTAVGLRLKATQIGLPTQYSFPPDYNSTLVLLRTSILDTSSTQRAIFGNQAVGPNVSRVATYSSLPRSYVSSVASMGAGGTTTLASAQTEVTGTYSAPTTPVLFFGSALLRHNYNQSASISKPSSLVSDYYYPQSNSRKLAKARVETTVGNYSEGLSPIYSSSAFRLLSPSEYGLYSQGGQSFQINAAVLAQDGTTSSSANIHGSDSMISFLPIKQGARYSYSRYRPSTVPGTSIVGAASFLGGPPSSNPLEFTVELVANGFPLDSSSIYSPDADCVLRLLIAPYTDSGLQSFVYVDVPVLGISVNNPSRVVIDSSYRWFVEQCLLGGAYADTHTVRVLKDFYTAPNSAPSLTTRAVLAVTRPVVDISGDQGESNQNLLSFANDRNLLLGEFSVAISRPSTVFDTALKVNVEAAPNTALEVYDSASIPASKVSSFDPNSLHLFIKSDGSLGCRRVLTAYNGLEVSTDPNPILPIAVREFITNGGLFSQVKVGESIIALLSSGASSRKLFLWGYNTYGQLDVPAAVDASFLTQGYISNVKEFDFNSGHIAVILDNGQLHSWGCTQSTVWQAGATSPISHMAIGENFSVAIVDRYNSASPSTPIKVIEQYGNSPSIASVPVGVTAATPTVVWASGLAGQTVYAGKILACGKNHAVLLKSDNTVVCWGNNTYGQCTVPVGLSGVIGIDAGDDHTIAIKNDGTIVCWGRNHLGQATVPAGLQAKSIAAGGNFSIAVRNGFATDVSGTVGSVVDDEIEDTVACWGDNTQGQCTPPVCEGASYNPSVHKYRMRFWGVKCGWDHAIGIRKDDVPSRWFQHAELNRLTNRYAIKLPFKHSGGTTIFPCLRYLAIEDSDPPVPNVYFARSSTGETYVLNETAAGSGVYASASVTVSGTKYRIVWNVSAATVTVESSPTSPTNWTTVEFNKDTYDPYQVLTSSPFYNISRQFYIGWDALSGTPAWRAVVDEVTGFISYATATTTGEYLGVDYATADAISVGLNRLFVGWGNPIAWAESLDSNSYTQYYPGTENLSASVGPDINPTPVKDSSAFNLNSIYSYVGYGKQLGIDLIEAGTNPLGSSYLTRAGEASLQNDIYIGPRVLQIVEPQNALSITTSAGSYVYYLGSNTVFLSVSGTPRYFNRPTPVGAASIRTYASPESGDGTTNPANLDSQMQGFNNRAVYVEAFTYALPAGYSIVANGSGSLPAGTPNSDTGYHLIFTGTVGGSSRTLVMTGAWAGIDSGTGNLSISLPFDITYSSGGILIDSSWLAALGITIKKTRVVKQQLSYGAATYQAYPGKHLTSYISTQEVLGITTWSASVRGLSISNSSQQITGGVKGYRSAFAISPLQYFAGFRSAVLTSRSRMNIGGKNPVTLSSYGDNKVGQLELRLTGPFSITPSEMNNYATNFSTNWLMNFGQTQIGHTETPALTYGFSKVVCGQFHTLAIDEDGYVHARGLNNAINPPKIKGITWDPFSFRASGCGLDSPADLTGYFSNLPGTDPASAALCATFNCNRAPAAAPVGSTSSMDLVGGTMFQYPNVPTTWQDSYNNTDCLGAYATDGVLFFDKAGFNDSDIVLISQKAGPAGNQGFVIGLEQIPGQSKLYISERPGAPKIYSEAFDPNPSLIYLSFPASRGTGMLPMRIRAKINGTYIKWPGDQYESPDVFAISYRRFMNCFGDETTVDPANNSTVLTERKPATAPTKMIAGDSFFLGLYNNEAEPRDRQCGSIMTTPTGPDFYPSGGNLGYQDGVQGEAFPALDFAGPKNYFISLVSRTYSQISGSVPAAGVYSGATATTLRYDGDANPNFKIYIGDEYAIPTEALDYSDETPNPGGRWPKVVFPNEPEWVSDLAHLPTEVYGFRSLGNSYTSEQFQFKAEDPTSNVLIYPAYPVVSVADELSRYITYDVASRRLLPQSYEPGAVVTSPSSVALGQKCAYAVKSNNTIFSWGQNYNSQRADAADISITCQKVVSAIEGSIVLKSDSRATVVGFNGGNLPAPIRSVPNFDFTDVAIAEYTAAGIKQTDGTVVCWGADYDGLLTPPSDLGVCTKVVGGKRHFAALTTNGKVVCWGDNGSGQLNVPVNAQSNVVKIVAGAYHTVALKSNGAVVCWGDNGHGQTTNPVGLGTGCLDIAAGYYHTVAIKSDNTLASWGADWYGTLVTSTPAGSYIKLGTGWSSYYAVAVRTTGTGGTMVSWGDTGAPYYTAVPDANTRRTVSFNPTTITQVGPYKHVVVAAPTQAEFTAAYNAIPASIRAKTTSRYYSSSQLTGLEHAIAVAAGSNSYYAIKAATYNATQGTLVAWGSAGSDGALTVPTGSTFTSVSSRNRHAAALRADGTVACWGSNTQGQAVSPAGTYSMVACGDTFTVAINASTNKLLAWGSISTIPAPYFDIQFSTVSAGKAHIVGRASSSYSQFVPGGTFAVNAGDILAFGDNSKGQCNVPGFSYSGENKGFNCPAVAGGEFTAYAMTSTGFEITSYVGGTGSTDQRVVAFVDNSLSEKTPDDPSYRTNYSDRLEGYIIHRAGALCPAILPLDHPYAINAPISEIYPNREPVVEAVQALLGFGVRQGTISNATNVPTAFRRGGSRKAKLVAAGRYQYHFQRSTRFPYGAGYSVIVSTDDEVIVFGGDLVPASCNALLYSPPAEALAIRNVASSGLIFGDVVSQLDTYRGQIYALKSTGDLVQWGYDDVSTSLNPEFYKVNTAQKQYFSLPDESLQDVLPRLQQFDYSNIALSYISGIPGVTDSWSVDVYLDRYFDGQKTTIRRFSAVGQSSLYSINDPVHFAETFLALDTWPGAATFLDSQYVLSIVPRGVSCTVNSASLFALNLDSKIGIQRVFRDGSNMGSDLSQPADFVIAAKNGTGFESTILNSYGSVRVTSASDNASAITLSSSNDFISPSFIRNTYGGSAKLEYVGSDLRSARTGGRVANPGPVTPANLGVRAWFKYESLSSTVGQAISSWSNSITTESITLAEGVPAAQPNVATFNTSFRGAQFDNSTADKLYAPASVAESSFTYFLVYQKPANAADIHAAIGKYALPGAGNPKVQGIGFGLGRPVLFMGSTYDTAATAVNTNPGVLCGYYGGLADRGLRVNGTPVTTWNVQNATTYMPATGIGVGYHLGGGIAGTTGTTTVNLHDTNDTYAEVVVVEGRLSDEDIQIVEGYLAHKFNLQANLPNNHPYKAAPASYDTLSSIYSLDLLDDPFLTLDSNRLTANNGRAETWLGMFELGLKHNSKRTTATGSIEVNHAPILAEFGFTVGVTTNALTLPIAATSLVAAADLSPNSTTKIMPTKAIAAICNVASVSLPKQRALPAAPLTPALTTGSVFCKVNMGLRGSASSKLGLFAPADCDPVYGCLGVSDLPPDLTVLSPGTVPLPINCISRLSASLGAYITIKFALIECKLAVTGSLSPTISLSGQASAVSRVNTPTLRTVNTFLGVSNILTVSKTEVCIPAFIIKPPSAPKITYSRPGLIVQVFPEVGGIADGEINPGPNIEIGRR